MKRRVCFSFILMATLLVVTTLVSSISNMPLSLYAAAMPQVNEKKKTLKTQDVPESGFDTQQQKKGSKEGRMRNGYVETGREGKSRLGSTPPRCEHKCEGCEPCHPIQIPTTTGRVGVQYANYEPEGWKCKCGTSYFNP